ncbi:hypothetical protein JHD49_11490, partial [Sulfurimonas sp. SAG-AH-194-C21]
MSHFLQKLLLVLLLTLTLQAHSGLTQKSITSIYPKPASTNVIPHTDIRIKFNVQLDKSKIEKISFKLKKIDKKIGFMFFKHYESIDGELRYEEGTKELVFKPNKLLEKGIYEVSVKHLKTTQKRMRKHLKQISFRFSVTDTLVASLSIRPNTIDLQVDENISIRPYLTYSDSSSYDIEADSCSTEDKTILQVHNTTITALKDGVTTLSCKYKNLTTTNIPISSYQIINGHRLPPMPDETLNNATLLGIDSNNNGVRDDVERWIYEKYENKHPIHIDIAMQAGRAYKKVLETPERALEIENEVGKPSFCQLYYQYSAQYYNEPLLVEKSFNTHYLREKVYFNTKERMDAYLEYDSLLSGGVYTLPSDIEKKKAC